MDSGLRMEVLKAGTKQWLVAVWTQVMGLCGQHQQNFSDSLESGAMILGLGKKQVRGMGRSRGLGGATFPSSRPNRLFRLKPPLSHLV